MKIPPDDHAALADEYAADPDVTLEAIADRYGASKQFVHRLVRRHRPDAQAARAEARRRRRSEAAAQERAAELADAARCEVCGTPHARRVRPRPRHDPAGQVRYARACSPECTRRLNRRRGRVTDVDVERDARRKAVVVLAEPQRFSTAMVEWARERAG